jgi:hypothetical protein
VLGLFEALWLVAPLVAISIAILGFYVGWAWQQ